MAKLSKTTKKDAKMLSKNILSTKGPMIRTTYEKITSVYASSKDKKPLFSVRCASERKVSLIKLAAVLVCAVLALVFAVLLIKRTVEKRRAKIEGKPPMAHLKDGEGVWYYDDSGNLVWQRDPNEELPF